MYNLFPYTMPNAMGNTGSLFGITSLFKRINWGTLLSNTQKTLNVMNQAIPLYYQVKPVIKNIRTISKIGREINNTPNNNSGINNIIESNNKIHNTSDTNSVSPTFFL